MKRQDRADLWDTWHVNSGPSFPHEKVVQFLYRNYAGSDTVDEMFALDLGCGSGIHLELATKIGMSVTGVDVSSFALNNARARIQGAGLPDSVLIRALLSELDFPSETFDLIISVGVLDYAGVSETAFAASRIPNWLRPGGKAFLIFAAAGDFRGETVRNLDLHCYTRREVDALFPSRDDSTIWVDQYITTYENDSYRQIDWLLTIERKL